MTGHGGESRTEWTQMGTNTKRNKELKIINSEKHK